MKVIHVVSSSDGGAGKAAKRLNDALNYNNIDSKLLTLYNKNEQENIISISNSIITKIIYKCLNKINQLILKIAKPTEYFTCDFFGAPILKNKYIKDADIIHLHWVNNGMMTYKNLKKLSGLNKKIVWTMHDINTFTGGCHYSGNCDNYRKDCKNCPYIKGKLSNIIWKNKINSIEKLDITIVGCSKWITKCASTSSILKNKECINIPNCVDMNKFRVIDRKIAREKLGIDENKKIILFGAMSSTSDKRKGFIQLKDALKKLPNNEYQCYVFGANEVEELPINTKTLGVINDEETLILAYNAADVFVAPSLQENLANTVVEAISCGTPVVSFDVGGMPDMIQAGRTGYLAKYLDTTDLAKGIIECSSKTEQLREECRKFAVENYSYENISKEFTRLYKKILGEKEYDKEC